MNDQLINFMNNLIEDSYPLSPTQQGILFLSLYSPGQDVYIIHLLCDMDEDLDVDAFWRAWERLVERHAILRSSFHWDGLDVPIQRVHAGANLIKHEEDLRGCSSQKQEAIIQDYIEKERKQGFDFDTAPLTRLGLFRLADARYKFVRTYHHLVTDRRSHNRLLQELFQFYEAFARGEDLRLEPSRPYKDYIYWLAEQDTRDAETYWRRTLSGFTTPTPFVVEQLPYDGRYSTPDIFEQQVVLSEELSDALRGFAKENQVTLNTIIQGAWAILLGRYSGQDDVIFGATRACRRSALGGADDIMGPMVNTLPVRVKLPVDQPLLDWLKEIRAQWVALRDVEHSSLRKVQEWSDVPAGIPIFESLVNFSYGSFNAAMRSLGPAFQKRNFHLIQLPAYPLSFTVFGETGLRMLINYDPARFRDDVVARMLGHLETLLGGMVDAPACLLGDLPMLPEAERTELLEAAVGKWNNFPPEANLKALFEEQVERYPSWIAVNYGDQQLTYHQLDQLTNQLARDLQERSVRRGDLVGVCLERSWQWVAALLGILKAGGVYVPLDPTYPQERLAYMIKDSQLRVVLSQADLIRRFDGLDSQMVDLDQDWQKIQTQTSAALDIQMTGDDLAYVMYTSGSTGAPKGISIPQKAIRRLVKDSDYIQLEPGVRIAQASNTSFDAATFEVWGALLNGGCLVGLEQEIVLDPKAYGRRLREENIEVLFVTTALFNQIAAHEPSAFNSLKTLMFGGEAVTPAWVWKVLQAGGPQRLLHVYGPTESTTFTAWEWVREVREDAGSIPIGKPIANTQIYVLDERMQLVPEGVVGELYIGGEGLAQGYLNRPELTAERFLPHPFAGPGELLYKTGDLVKWVGGGRVEFVGRIDHQVKMRGYRIELGEIESRLLEHPGIEGAVVLLREDQPGEKRLAAYLLPSEDQQLEIDALRMYLRERLPDYMVPTALVVLDEFPLTPNGKVDRKALPQPAKQHLGTGDQFVAPRTDLERLLVRIWEDVLEVKPVGIRDNFFELGGHSLLAIRLFNQIEQSLDRRLPLAMLFEAPTIAELVRSLAGDQKQRFSSLVPIQPEGENAPFFFVHTFGGEVLDLKPLVDAMGPQQPFYALQARGLDGLEEPHHTIPEMAAHYVQAIRSKQPKGPYYLGGYCFGGVVAYEMACQLDRIGETVAFLAAMDASPPNQPQASGARRNLMRISQTLKNLPYWLRDFANLGYTGARIAVTRRLIIIRKGFESRLGGRKTALTPQEMIGDIPHYEESPPHIRRLMELHMRAIMDYTPPQYAGKVTLFRVRRNPLFSYQEEDKGWGKLAGGGVDLVYVPGGHNDLLWAESVQDIARELVQRIRQAQAAG